jgi:two-component system NtrC family response regulator
MSIPRVMVVEDDESLRRVIQTQIAGMGYKVSVAESVDQALETLHANSHDLILTDLQLPGRSGLDLLKIVRSEYPETAVILMTAFGSVANAVEAMKSGAYDYLTKPLHPYELRALINRAMERSRLLEEVRTLRSSIDRKFGFENILGRSSVLMRVLDNSAQAASTDATILIRGETGTGKELLAKAIHFNSARRDKPFIVINCGAIPKELLESELFGHVRGSFTGALTHKKGRVEMADGGTVFLDEIGEMPLELQVRILRFLQEREIEKVGATQTQPIKVDVRMIAATHRNLQKMVEEGTFREDLYYRLAVVPLDLPPLRDRREDIPEFVQQFFERTREKLKKEHLNLPTALLPYFQSYRWPGNVREIENVVERIVVFARGEEVTVADLPEFLRAQTQPESPKLALPDQGVSLEAVERNMILSALCKFNGNQSKAARYLGISRKVLLTRMAKYRIQKAEVAAASASQTSKPASIS